MSKKVQDCVQRLLADPSFNRGIGSGKPTEQTLIDMANAICLSTYRNKESIECKICDIEDTTLFQEALNDIMKEAFPDKNVESCIKRLMASSTFKKTISSDKNLKRAVGKDSSISRDLALAACTARSLLSPVTKAVSGVKAFARGFIPGLPKLSAGECMICDIEDNTVFEEALEQIMKEESFTQLMKEKSVLKNVEEESYTLEGIAFDIFKETISDEDLEKINKFAVKPIESKDVVVYTALLIDDKVTRNNTQYNKDFQSMLLSLPPGEGNFIGAPILFGDSQDHQHAANAQVGRIFDAYQVIDKEKHFGVMAKIYLLKETNEDLITKIDSGVLKEMSISTKVELPLCSLCGQSIRTCDHAVGVNGCHVIMSGKGFVAEASFVAVPGSNAAKILNDDETKNFLRLENLKDLVAPMIAESITGIPVIPKETIDGINEQLLMVTANYDNMIINLDKLNATLDEMKAKNEQTTVYPFDILSALLGLKKDIDEGKKFVISTLAKYDIPAAEFRVDVIPDLTQGLRGEDSGLIVKILYDNTVVLGINLSKIEAHLKVVPTPTNPTFTGDVNDLVATVRFMNDSVDIIKTRIYKLQGKFDLELEQRNALIQETIKFGILSGKFDFNEKNLSLKFFEEFSTEEIVTLKEKFFTEGSKLFTPEIVVEPEPPKETEDGKKVDKPASLRETAKKILNGGHTNG